MSKFKKNKKVDLFDLEEFFDEYLKEYEVREVSNEFDTPTNSTVKIIGHNDNFYDALMHLYVQDLETISRNIQSSPNHVISGSGPAWFYEPLTKTFAKAERGSEVVVIPGEEDEYGRVLVRISNGTGFLMIPHEEVLNVGYN